MRGAGNVKIRISVTEQLIRFILCRRLKGARGNVYTIKAAQICAEIFRGESKVPVSCKVTVRRYLLGALYDAIVHDLTDKYRIVVNVGKAWELLGCEEYED
ncbi:hypothetical protein PyrSV_gp38 [Pyrobaculum spherical virus]|jgi:hypothetical protein|uniref:Uncharacterized protein n=1 Tax=Pyrobaculum spherical virus (isolate United States/Yellowstone) TaxID=654907 RepID=Q6ZYG5_PSVY|nr:hypothetical protein PyrSV_gp38 [Pyrobaculum spherical virus]CAG25657.1 hypothetical protein [Pyrobaculum spherical virus]